MARRCIEDCSYNLTKQLAKKAQFLWNVDKYLKGAKKVKDSKCAGIWEDIGKDEERHAEMLKDHLLGLQRAESSAEGFRPIKSLLD